MKMIVGFALWFLILVSIYAYHEDKHDGSPCFVLLDTDYVSLYEYEPKKFVKVKDGIESTLICLGYEKRTISYQVAKLYIWIKRKL